MMLLAGLLILTATVVLLHLFNFTKFNLKIADIALCAIAIVTGVLVFLDK